MFAHLVERVLEQAPTANVQTDDRFFGCGISLGYGTLEYGTWYEGRMIPVDAFSHSGWDVISGAYIRVIQVIPKSGFHVGYGSSLWYMRRSEQSPYRWQEVSYMTVLGARKVPYEPFELMELEEADLATSNVMHVYQGAFGPHPIDDEDIEQFCERWLERLALASQGHLQRPDKLPLE